MTEETTSKKQDFIVKLNEWRKKYSDCQILMQFLLVIKRSFLQIFPKVLEKMIKSILFISTLRQAQGPRYL